MKRKVVTVMSVTAVLAVFILSLGASECGKAAKAQQRGCCPGSGMTRTSGTGQAKATCSPEAGAKSPEMCNCPRCMMAFCAQKSGEMMLQFRVIMQTKISSDSPAAILGQAQTLGLSEAQNQKLLEIEKQAREKALAVLTPVQREKLGDFSAPPVSIASMCQKMCGKMMAGIGKDAHSQMMCPMMQRTTQSKDKQTQLPLQTICPVMGGKINKNVFTVYKGKKVYFCCPGCKPKFEKEPEKYIVKLPQFKN